MRNSERDKQRCSNEWGESNVHGIREKGETTGERMKKSGRKKKRGGGGAQGGGESGRFCAHPSLEGGNKMAGGRWGDTSRINFID